MMTGASAKTVTAPNAHLSLITEPDAGIAPISKAIETAGKKPIRVVMYEFEDTDLETDLVAAHDRGAKVQVLLNGGYYGGGSDQNQQAYGYFKAHHVPVRWTPSYFALTHEKMMLIGNTAYIMTFNWTPQYYSTSRDFAVVDKDKTDVAAIKTTFDADWADKKITAPNGKDLVWSPGSEQAQVELINSVSKGYIDIYNEEMDDQPIEDALAAAVKRGVKVRVVMTESSDWDNAFDQLTAAGVSIHLFPDSSSALYIHAKMILTPQRAFVGSENFSWTSLNRNRELGIIFSAKPILKSLHKTFDGDYADAQPFKAAGSGSSSSDNAKNASCKVSASYSSSYGDWDVYVHSNQPETTATVTGAGTSADYKTDSSGYADIYFKAPKSAAGQKITVQVGSATCTGTL